MITSLWVLGRAFGISALVLLSLVVALGIVVRTGRPLPGMSRAAQSGLHRTLSLAAVEVVALHVATLWADPYAQLRIADALLPFAGRLHPVGLGLGTVALELLLALVISSALRRRVGLRVWRAIHWAAYLCWPAAVVHALGTGTDRATAWLLWTVAGCCSLIGAALTWRLVHRPPRPRPQRLQAPRHLAGLS